MLRPLFRLSAARRSLSSKSTMTAGQRDAALKDANEKMRQYQLNRPSLEVIHESKRRSKQRDNEHYIQALILGSFLAAFVMTPFLGHRIATDEDFRKRLVPSWYDFSIEKPKSAWTRAELHEQLVQVQSDLHERAIRGEFTPEKLEEMRRHFDGVDPKNDKHGWGKLHPGVDDDEDVED